MTWYQALATGWVVFRLLQQPASLLAQWLNRGE